MTVAELRALLDTLPERFDGTEVMVYGSPGLYHVDYVDLDRRRMKRDDISDTRLERKLRIMPSRVLWFDRAPKWRLLGWWPAEAADVGQEVD